MIKENFEIWPSEMHYIDSILLLSILNSFTMVEEHFEIWPSEMLQIDSILLLSISQSFTLLEKKLKYVLLKCDRLTFTTV